MLTFVTLAAYLLLLVVPGGPSLHISGAAIVVGEQYAVSPGQLRGRAGVGGGDRAVQDAKEPDHQTNYVLRFEGGVVHGVRGRGADAAVTCVLKILCDLIRFYVTLGKP